MPSSSIKFDGLAEAIVSEAAVFNPADALPDGKYSKYYLSDSAMWDTGAEMTIISRQIAEGLGLKPTGRGGISGVGGDDIGDMYTVHIGLPNGKMLKNIPVFCATGELDYDLIIGMDIITLTDFLITNKDNTVFSFRYPSEGNVELK